MAGAGNQNYRNQHDATDDRTELILSFHCRGDDLRVVFRHRDLQSKSDLLLDAMFADAIV